jgi:hypothetical protein
VNSIKSNTKWNKKPTATSYSTRRKDSFWFSGNKQRKMELKSIIVFALLVLAALAVPEAQSCLTGCYGGDDRMTKEQVRRAKEFWGRKKT